MIEETRKEIRTLEIITAERAKLDERDESRKNSIGSSSIGPHRLRKVERRRSSPKRNLPRRINSGKQQKRPKNRGRNQRSGRQGKRRLNNETARGKEENPRTSNWGLGPIPGKTTHNPGLH
jgi:hypothetical protein